MGQVFSWASRVQINTSWALLACLCFHPQVSSFPVLANICVQAQRFFHDFNDLHRLGPWAGCPFGLFPCPLQTPGRLLPFPLSQASPRSQGNAVLGSSEASHAPFHGSPQQACPLSMPSRFTWEGKV